VRLLQGSGGGAGFFVSRSDREVAFLFPGQGSQIPGAGREYLRVPASRRVFEEADELLGWSVSDLCAHGSPEELAATARAQPALLTLSIAALRVLEEEAGVRPFACLGHSLGEYSALVAAGSLGFADALHCVQCRGEFMDEVLPPRTGGMAAVLGLERREVERVCREVAGDDVLGVANLNAPGQVVVSGHLDAIGRCTPGLKAAGARRVVRLKVSSAFHSPLMRPAARRLREVLDEVPVDPPRRTVLSNVTAQPHGDPESIRALLVLQVTSPVLWEDCVRWVINQGVKDFLELGPGEVLAGLNRVIDRSTRTRGVDAPAAVRRLTRSIGQEKAS
jgi:[acyl-carrier-protein] S-malonyltransferase